MFKQVFGYIFCCRTRTRTNPMPPKRKATASDKDDKATMSAPAKKTKASTTPSTKKGKNQRDDGEFIRKFALQSSAVELGGA